MCGTCCCHSPSTGHLPSMMEAPLWISTAKNIELPLAQLSANDPAKCPGEARCQHFLFTPNLHPIIQSFPLPTIAHWCRLEVPTQVWEIGDPEMPTTLGLVCLWGRSFTAEEVN